MARHNERQQSIIADQDPSANVITIPWVIPDEWVVSPGDQPSSSSDKEFSEILHTIVSGLKPNEGEGFRASIQVPLQTGLMGAIIFLSESLESEIRPMQTDFSWKEPIKSIAGLCATYRNPIWLPDVNDKSHPFSRYWQIPKTYPNNVRSGGVIAVPIVDESKQRVLAVLSVTSTERNFFTTHDLAYLTSFSEQFTEIIVRYNRGIDEGWYDVNGIIPMGNERPKPDEAQRDQGVKPENSNWTKEALQNYLAPLFKDKIVSREAVEQVLHEYGYRLVFEPLDPKMIGAIVEIKKEIHTNPFLSHRKRETNTVCETVLNMFTEAGQKGLPYDAILSLFSYSKNPQNSAIVLLRRVNDKLEDKNFHIKSHTVLRITLLTENTSE